MQSPIREQLRINDRWHARQLSEKAARVFVPGPWANRRVVLTPHTGANWSAARIGEHALEQEPQGGSWKVDSALTPGEWNTVTAEDGALTGAQLTASSVLHISDLEATAVSDRCLSIRIKLAGHEQQVSAPADLLTIYFSLTDASGEQAGGLEVTIAPKSRGLSIEMPLSRKLSGTYRLKASLCNSVSVIDNARILVNG